MSEPLINVELHHFGPSLCSRQVRLVLAEKGVRWVSRPVNLLAYEQLRPAYLALNPNGVVPTLVEGGEPRINSLAIMRHLDAEHDGPSLLPRAGTEPETAELTEVMEDWIAAGESLPIGLLVHRLMPGWKGDIYRKINLGKPAAIERLKAAYPEHGALYDAKLARTEAFLEKVKDRALFQQVSRQVEDTLDALDARVTNRDYICGKRPTLADFIWGPILYRLWELRLASMHPEPGRPRLAAYFRRLKERPSWKFSVELWGLGLAEAYAGWKTARKGLILKD